MPAIQFHWPSGEHAPDSAPEVVFPPDGDVTGAGAAVGELTGVSEEATSDAEGNTSEATGLDEAIVTRVVGTGFTGTGVTAGVEDDATGADDGCWANAPPLALAEAEAPPPLALAEAGAPPPLLEPESLQPVIEPALFPVSLSTTSGPGFGKMTSFPSTVTHPLPKFA